MRPSARGYTRINNGASSSGLPLIGSALYSALPTSRCLCRAAPPTHGAWRRRPLLDGDGDSSDHRSGCRSSDVRGDDSGDLSATVISSPLTSRRVSRRTNLRNLRRRAKTQNQKRGQGAATR